AVGFVLLIVCANTASLLLARATSRSREFAVQAAIGAGRGRIIRQLLVECMLMACLGGALGVALSAWGLKSVSSATFLDLPRAGEIRMDSTALAFAAGLSIFTGMLFGMAPSLAASRPDLSAVLRASGEGGLGAGSKPIMRFSPRGLLVVGQVALSIVLLIAAMLLIESLVRLNRVNPGFQSASLLTMKIALPPIRYDTDQKKAKFYEELVQRTESLPGVRSAAVAQTLPMTGFIASRVQPVGWTSVKPDDLPISIVQGITPGYFRTMEITLKRGREFTARDNAESVPVVIINESLARLFWTAYPGGQDPVGQHILLGSNPQPKEIVGISADVRQAAKDQEPRPGIYIPCAQKPPQSAMLAVRTAGNPLSLANAVRNQVLSLDRDQPVSEVATMEEVVEASEGQLRLMMRLLGVLAVAATFLAAAGLYAVISYSVIQRTRELGIRRALGAQPSDILYLVVRQGLGLSLAGVVLGLGAAFVLTGVMKGMLFQVSAADPATFGVISILFIVISLVASYIPARRAVAINPLIALRVG
ncbi:MAG TPA: FtsX-like permease family protein, partial [Candidatus Angelobacter sp.]|nr:FtsX-like permease family protein [Candidatus Angelobacter sp.]